jgi:mRNA-degrading endonuclease RelE of RelBE toxin-antitoxin system
MSTLLQSLAEAAKGDFDSFAYEYDFIAALETIWSPPSEPVPQTSESRSLESLDDIVSFSLDLPDPTPWSIAFTPTFRKSVGSVDKKLQGRVLVALSELSEAPLKPHGDTVKPLVGDLSGLWRYRVGDYRLVYQPKQDSHTVVLLEFAARGGAYE